MPAVWSALLSVAFRPLGSTVMERWCRAIVWYACLQLLLGVGAQRPIAIGHEAHGAAVVTTAPTVALECASFVTPARTGIAYLDVAEPDVDPSPAARTCVASVSTMADAARPTCLRRIVAPNDSQHRLLRSVVLLA